MSLSQEQMLDVMAYADDELEGEDLERTRTLVDTNAEAKELLASLRALGDGVRGSFDVGDIDVAHLVLSKLTPNDLDKVRIRRTARVRMAVVGASLVALAAAILFYVRDMNSHGPVGQTTSTAPQSVLASSDVGGVQVDFVDTPSAVSVFYVPSSAVGAEETASETAPSVVVWVNDDTPKAPETTP